MSQLSDLHISSDHLPHHLFISIVYTPLPEQLNHAINTRLDLCLYKLMITNFKGTLPLFDNRVSLPWWIHAPMLSLMTIVNLLQFPQTPTLSASPHLHSHSLSICWRESYLDRKDPQWVSALNGHWLQELGYVTAPWGASFSSPIKWQEQTKPLTTSLSHQGPVKWYISRNADQYLFEEIILEKSTKLCIGLAASSFTCREVGSHHSLLITSKKLNRLKNQLFLDP